MGLPAPSIGVPVAVDICQGRRECAVVVPDRCAIYRHRVGAGQEAHIGVADAAGRIRYGNVQRVATGIGDREAVGQVAVGDSGRVISRGRAAGTGVVAKRDGLLDGHRWGLGTSLK